MPHQFAVTNLDARETSIWMICTDSAAQGFRLVDITFGHVIPTNPFKSIEEVYELLEEMADIQMITYAEVG